MNQFRIQAIINTHENVTHATMDKAFDVNNLPVLINEDKVIIEMNRMQDEYDALQYQRDRQYPSIGDQLDMQYHDELNGTTTWKDAVAKVKADNPKP